MVTAFRSQSLCYDQASKYKENKSREHGRNDMSALYVCLCVSVYFVGWQVCVSSQLLCCSVFPIRSQCHFQSILFSKKHFSFSYFFCFSLCVPVFHPLFGHLLVIQMPQLFMWCSYLIWCVDLCYFHLFTAPPSVPIHKFNSFVFVRNFRYVHHPIAFCMLSLLLLFFVRIDIHQTHHTNDALSFQSPLFSSARHPLSWLALHFDILKKHLLSPSTLFSCFWFAFLIQFN